jgi:signal transduction histidine kinase/DNA-binding response OmpR family regulator
MAGQGRNDFVAHYNVLLIEDDDADAHSLTEALSDASKLRFVRVSRVSEGIEQLVAGNIDAVVLDLSLPDATGLGGVRRIRTAAPGVPVLVMTSIRDANLAAQMFHHGAQDYIVKGDFEVAEVGRRIRDALERQHYMSRASVLALENERRALADERRASWLAEAGRLLAGSLDYEETLKNIKLAALGSYADTCVVELAVPREAPASMDGKLAARIWQVMQNGETWFDDDAADALVVPMTIGERRIGVIAMTFSAARGKLSQPDRFVGEAFGHRAALALENVALYQKARAAIALREEFLSIASHELRTPLATLQLQLQLLQHKFTQSALPQPSEVTDRLRKCLGQTSRVTRLIGTLLDVALITNGEIVLKPEALDLAILVRESVDRFLTESTASADTFVFHNGTEVAGLWDRGRLEQVVTNLLTNGVKYGKGAPVEVIVETQGAVAVLTVRDRGIGIDAQDLPRIFGRFERAATARLYSGLGLGLYVSRQIVEAHGGTIAVESEPGKGSLFTVRLPLRADRTGAEQ